MPDFIHTLDGWSFLLGFSVAYLTMGIALITLIATSKEIKE